MKMRKWLIVAAAAMAMVALVACRQPGSDTQIFSVGLSAPPPHWDAVSGLLTLPGFARGEEPTYKKVTITNTGNQPTGELTVGVIGNYFAVEPTVGSIAVGATATFTVTAAYNLLAYSHTATVTVSGGNNIGATFDVKVTVTTADVPVGSIAITQNDPYTIPMGDTGRQLAVTFTPHNATERGITWASDDPTYVTVDGEGRLTGVAVGYANITATSVGNPNAMASIRVNVVDNYVSVTSVEITYTGSLSLTEGETLVLTATVLPDNATSLNVVWAGFNAHVGYTVAATQNANVSTITISALTPGTATVRASAGEEHDEVIIRSYGELAERFEITLSAPSVDNLLATGLVFAATSYQYMVRPGAITVTVRNTGNMPTGDLTASVTGTAFELSSTTIDSLVEYEDYDVFTVQPVIGLGVGTHTANVTVAGANGISVSFPVSLTVSHALANPFVITGEGVAAGAVTIDLGSHVDLSVAITPANADRSVTWTIRSQNPANVVTLGTPTNTPTIRVTAGAVAGTAVVRATAGGGMYAEITITVTEPAEVVRPVTNVTIMRDGAEAADFTFDAMNQTVTFFATVYPSNATNQTVTWSGFNNYVGIYPADSPMTGNSITIRANAEGAATIVATADGMSSGGVTATVPYIRSFVILPPVFSDRAPQTVQGGNFSILGTPGQIFVDNSGGNFENIRWFLGTRELSESVSQDGATLAMNAYVHGNQPMLESYITVVVEIDRDGTLVPYSVRVAFGVTL